ncbi:MAG: histidine kinase [bacterium]|nr:histidine kinase [bacterium]
MPRFPVVICRALLAGLLLIGGLFCSPAPEPNPEVEESSPRALESKLWSYRWGQSPADPEAPDGLLWARTTREVPGWQSAGEPFVIQKSIGDSQLWLRLRIPDEPRWVDPTLFFENISGIFIMYYEDRILYSRGDMQTQTDDLRSPRKKMFRLGPLSDSGAPRYLIMRFYASPEVEIEIDLSDGDTWLGDRYDLLMMVLRREIIALILGSMFMVIGVVALGAYLRRGREPGSKLYLSFSLFTLFSGVSTVNDLNLAHLLITMSPLFWDWSGMLATILIPVGILSFYEQVFGPGYKNCIRRLWQFHIVLGAALVVTVLLFYARYSATLPALVVAIQMIILTFWISIGLMLVILTITTFSSALRGNVQAKLFFAGTLIISISAVPDFISGFAEIDSAESESYYHWGLLIFMALLLYIAEQHFEDTRVNLAAVRANYERTRRELASAKLKSLQERMSPHFLFNSLNTIHAMLTVDPPAADRALISLADNYRFLTEQHDRPLVPFDEEWRFLENYLELSRLRFRDTIDIRLEREGDFQSVQVPPLIFQPIVENSIQHGLRARSGTGYLQVRARRVGRWISVEFRDDGAGLPANSPVNQPEYAGTIGNIRSRLRYYYAGSALILKNNADGTGVRALLCFRDPNLSRLDVADRDAESEAQSF